MEPEKEDGTTMSPKRAKVREKIVKEHPAIDERISISFFLTKCVMVLLVITSKSPSCRCPSVVLFFLVMNIKDFKWQAHCIVWGVKGKTLVMKEINMQDRVAPRFS